MRNQYKVLAEVYEQKVQEARPRGIDFIDDEHYEFNGKPYNIEAKFDWEEKAVSHQASIGHHGVTGKDIYGMVPVGIEWIEVTDVDGNVITDLAVIKDASQYALTSASEDPSRYVHEEKKPTSKPAPAKTALKSNPFINKLKDKKGSLGDLGKRLG